MKKTVKYSIIVTILTLVSLMLFGLYKAIYVGNYMAHNPSTGVLMIMGATVLTVIALSGVRYLMTLCVCGLVLLQSCNYAKSNQQVVVSQDCGMTWERVKPGEAVPKGGTNPCYMKVVMPNFPMQGDSKFISNLKDKVKVTTHLEYDYSITDALHFINQAKSLGKANKDADDNDALDPKAFEGAENTVIDKRIRELAKDMLLREDIVELNQAEFENALLAQSNKVLEPLGVQLNFISLVFEPDDQTRQAIDVCTAMKIYESRGLTELGKQVIVEKAGAANIKVENSTTQQATQKE